MSEKILKQEILSAYLKVDSGACELSSISLKQLVLKVLFTFDEGLPLSELKHQIKQTLGVKINPKRIERVVEELISVDELHKHDQKLYVSDTRKSDINKTVNNFQNSIDRIINKYFIKADVDKNIIKTWFES